MLTTARPRVHKRMGWRVVASDELELYSLRIRFLAVSEQITIQLAGLAQRICGVPPTAQASLLVLAGQIAAAQQRLRYEIDQLVGYPRECAEILQIALRAQLAVSTQLANILSVEQIPSHFGTKLAKIAQQLAQVHHYDPSPTNRQTWEGATERGEHDDLSRTGENAWPRYHPVSSLAPSEDEEASRSPDDDLGHTVTLISRIRAGLSAIAADTSSRSLALAGCLLCGLFVAYARLTGGDQHELATRSLPAAEPKVAAVPRVRLPLAQAQKSVARAAYAEAILPEAETDHGGDPDLPATATAPDPIPPFSTANALVLKFPERIAGPVPQADHLEGTVTSAKPLAASKPIPANPSYVPVVLTHKDKDMAKRAFAELQLRYPKLLRNRRSEVREVNMGEKGIWYRVSLLPPGPRQQAAESCARLAAAGHDRCWVKEYQTD